MIKTDARASCPIGVDIHSVLDHVKRKEFQLRARPARNRQSTAIDHIQILWSALQRHVLVRQTLPRCRAVPWRPLQADTTESQGRKTESRSDRGRSGRIDCRIASSKARLNVKLIEAMEKAGGSLSRSTPEFRLPSKIAQQEVAGITSCIELQTHAIGGAMHPLDELAHKFDAVVIATGANKPAFPLESPARICPMSTLQPTTFKWQRKRAKRLL